LLALVAGFLLLGRGQSSSDAAPTVIKPLHPVKKHAAAAPKKVAQTVKAKPVAKPKKKIARPKPSVIDGMPAALAQALDRNAVVVVALYAPRSSVDQMSTQEAKQGAKLAGAGFVALNVASEKVVGPLTSLLTGAATPADRVLDDPAVLVFQSPKTLFVRFNGFTDRDTVAQAAANAGAVATASTASSGTWATRANAICTEMATQVQALPFPTSGADVLNWVDGLDKALSGAVARLHALPAPAGQAAQVKQMLAAYDRAVTGFHTALAAAKRGQKVDSDALQKQTAAYGKQADAIARQLGANACGGGF